MKLIKSKPFIIHLIMAAIIACLFLLLYFYVEKESARVRSFTFDRADGTVSIENITLRMTIPDDKLWVDEENHADMPTGAQYDFAITNSGERKITDWSVTVDFSKDFKLDSSWNGKFIINGRTMNFYPDAFTRQRFVTDSTTTFGAVLYAKKELKVKKAVINGHLPLMLTELWAFYVLAGAAFIWLISFSSLIITFARLERLRNQHARDLQIIEQSIQTFTNFIDAKDPYTRGHSIRVALYSRELGRRYGMSGEELSNLYYTALLHDAGKIGIKDAILTKPAKLTNEEYEIIKTHTTIGDAMLANFTAIDHIREGAHYHHERYDGKGYPVGLSGDEIPLNARIICVADSFDAMNSKRNYRGPLSREKIFFELDSNSGTQFDPKFVALMKAIIMDGFTLEVQKKYP